MAAPSSSASTDYFNDDDDSFIEALHNLDMPTAPHTSLQYDSAQQPPRDPSRALPSCTEPDEDVEIEMPPPAQPRSKRSRVSDDEEDADPSSHQVIVSIDDSYYSADAYGPSKFGDFGGYMSRKRAKLQIQNAELDDRGEGTSGSGIFQGLQIYINGWTQPSIQDLRQLIMQHGGIFHAYLDKKSLVTHIITCTLTPAKMRDFQYMKVVRPEWLVESAKAGVLLPWKDFIFKAGLRVDESQGKKVAQRSLFDNFIPSQPAKNSDASIHTPKSASRITSQSSPSTNASIDDISPASTSPVLVSSPPRVTSNPFNLWNPPDPNVSSPEMPPPRQPPRPSTPETPVSGTSTRAQAATPHHSNPSLSSPVSPPDPSPPPPAQRPRKPTQSPEQFLLTQRPARSPSKPHPPSREHDVPASLHTQFNFALPSPSSPISPTSPESHSQSKPKYAAHESNPNAQRVMANPAWRAAHTSVAPDFIEGYYRNSRLHHLASWKAELKGLVAEALERAEKGSEDGGSTSGPECSEDQVREGEVEVEDPVARVVRENMRGRNGNGGGDGGEDVSMKDAQLVLRSPSRSRLKAKEKERDQDKDERVIMHCDFDSFFVSAGLVERPDLRGKPVVVCHSQGAQGGGASTSEIASASYEARKFGIKGGMSLQQARKLCPSVVTIPYEFQKYKKYSLQFYTILMGHADDLQAVSVDEALIDVTSSIRRIKAYMSQSNNSHERENVDLAKDFADAIRSQVRKTTNCEVSIGIAHNIMLARLASRKAKPAGSFHILPSDVPAFLAPLDIDDLHGFGYSARQKAEDKLGTTNLGELVKKSKGVLCEVMGKATGEMLYKAVRGVDERKLESDKPRKSVSCDINYGIRFENNEQAETFIFQLAEEVAKRLNDIEMKGRSLTLKVMKRDPSAPVEAPKFMGHGMCETFSKQVQIVAPGGRATSDGKVIGEHAWRLLKSFDFDAKELRGIAIQIQKLEKTNATGPEVEQGQAILPFKRVEKPSDAPNPVGPQKPLPLPTSPLPDIRVHAPTQSDKIVEVTKPSKLTNAPAPTLDLPTFSQVDISVLEALPEDIRRELEAEYKRRAAPKPQAEAGPSKPRKDLTAFLLPPAPKPRITVKGTKITDIKRITKQLAPRNKSNIPSMKSVSLFGKREIKSPSKNDDSMIVVGSGGVATTKGELGRLGIDPEVFSELPRELQLEQLRAARLMQANKGRGQVFGGPRKVLKPIRAPRYVDPDYVPYIPPPPPKANYGPLPASLKRPGKQKGDLVRFTGTDEIMDVIKQWVENFAEYPPHGKDVQFFAKYLVKCVDPAISVDSGMERGVAVLKWWLVLLRRKYGVWENKDEDDEEDLWDSPLPKNRNGFTSKDIGRAWWSAFRDVKGQMDIAAAKKFGGRISLK